MYEIHKPFRITIDGEAHSRYDLNPDHHQFFSELLDIYITKFGANRAHSKIWLPRVGEGSEIFSGALDLSFDTVSAFNLAYSIVQSGSKFRKTLVNAASEVYFPGFTHRDIVLGETDIKILETTNSRKASNNRFINWSNWLWPALPTLIIGLIILWAVRATKDSLEHRVNQIEIALTHPPIPHSNGPDSPQISELSIFCGSPATIPTSEVATKTSQTKNVTIYRGGIKD